MVRTPPPVDPVRVRGAREGRRAKRTYVHALPALFALAAAACPGGDGAPATPTEPAPDPPGPELGDSAVVLWTAGMETGDLSEWAAPGGRDHQGGEFNSGGGDAWASQEQARTGGWSARLELDDGEGGTRMFRWGESERYPEAYYSAWLYFPQRYEPDVWWNIFQFKSKVGDRNDALWVVNVGNRSNGDMHLYLWDALNERSFGQDRIDIPVGEWFKITCFYRQALAPSGRITCWQDDTLLWDRDGVSTMYPNARQHWSVNNYTDGVAPAPAVIYVDDAAVSWQDPGS